MTKTRTTDGQRHAMDQVEAIGLACGCELSTYPADPAYDGIHVSVAASETTPDGTPLPSAVTAALEEAGYELRDHGYGIWAKSEE